MIGKKNFVLGVKMTLDPETGPEAPRQTKNVDEWLPITSKRNAKWWYSTFHNVTAMVGAGVLSLPYAMSEMGWYVTILNHVCLFFVTYVWCLQARIWSINCLCILCRICFNSFMILERNNSCYFQCGSCFNGN